MKKLMRWTGIVLGGVVVLLALAGFVLYLIGVKQLNQTYPNITVENINIPADADDVDPGQHIAIIWARTRCHGQDLSGRMITNDPLAGMVPLLGTIPAPNLTSGQGGIAPSYTDADWVRAIRHGVLPDGQVEVLMFDYSTLSDQDLGDLIAYLKQIPAVDTNFPEDQSFQSLLRLDYYHRQQKRSLTASRVQLTQRQVPRSNMADIFLQFAPYAMATLLATW